MYICEQEKVDFSEEMLLHILPHAQGDYRRLINILEYICIDCMNRGDTIEWITNAIEHFDKKNKHMDCYQTTEKILLNNLTHEECLYYENKDSSMTKMLI